MSATVCISMHMLTQVCSSRTVWSKKKKEKKNTMTLVRACGGHVELSRWQNPVNELRVGATQSDLCSL